MRPRLALVVALALGCGRDEPVREHAPAAVARTESRPRPEKLAHVTIKALGMYCEESCPLAVRKALADVPAVYELGFDLPHESVFVSYDAALGSAAAVTKPMLAAIRGAGFDPWVAKEEWPVGVTAEVIQKQK